MSDTLLMTYRAPIASPATLTRSAARAAIEGARLSWSAFVADEGDYPVYPASVVWAWTSAKVY